MLDQFIMSGLLISIFILFGPSIVYKFILTDAIIWAFFIVLQILIFTHPKLNFAKMGAEESGQSDKKSLIFINIAAYGTVLPIYALYLFKYSHQKTPNIQIIQYIGLIIALFGVLFRWYAIKYLGQWFTSAVVIQKNHKIVMTGPYKFIRHPSYTGAILFWGATPLIFNIIYGFLWAIPLLIGAYAWRIYVEEEQLSQNVDGYKDYIKKTNRLFPYIF